MSLLLTVEELTTRRNVAAGPLAPLFGSLAADLKRVIGADLYFPAEKARLSRAGGRCPRDGTPLDFDPWSPRAHRCPTCGNVYDDEAHYRYWLMWYQLWLAERAVHGAALFALGGDARHADLAARILSGYAARYLDYPNSDNVLGPSRIFFSTYLESIWLLQICVAIDLLETTGKASANATRDSSAALAGEVRDRIVAPAAKIIADYDEGTSNRQAWNVAALFAAARVLDDKRAALDAVNGPSGLLFLLSRALLADGSWYEGENYHVFAHRGLWYGVMMAERAGIELPPALVARFDAGFALPWRTALPDMTMLARRDSQYAVSLRQWRFAELCELGLVRGDTKELGAALARLYDGSVSHGDTGRSRSSAEAERHYPASGLTRADLGWRSLLHASAKLPALESTTATSVLLPGQGLAVLRRDGGSLMVALDYGESGGGHGHPDRLNLVVADGATRWLDDPGTGSYVDRSLHWYRSTLAHCAPLVDRTSQWRVPGTLIGYDDRGAAGWVAARVDDIVPGVSAERQVVVMPDYLVDELTWSADGPHHVALPLHVDGEIDFVSWTPAILEGEGGLEDGFDFVHDAERTVPGSWPVRLRASRDSAAADVWIAAPAGTVLWRARAPGPPGQSERRFHLLESARARGAFTTVLSWRGRVARVALRDVSLVIEQEDGGVHEHARRDAGWHVDMKAGGARSSIDLVAPPLARTGTTLERGESPLVPDDARQYIRLELEKGGRSGTIAVDLGAPDYRRSEQTWQEAGKPSAEVKIWADRAGLHVAVESRTGAPVILAEGTENDMDNEVADVNASGVQLYLRDGRGALTGWLVRPDAASEKAMQGKARDAHVRPLARGAPAIKAHWAPTAAGWMVESTIPYAALGDGSPYSVEVGLVVNEIPPGRERRRGQLVLGGADGEWVYLRGDRHDPARMLSILID